MSKQEYPTLSMVIPLYYLLVETLNEATNKENIPQWLAHGCEAATTKLLGYCQKLNILNVAAVILDPRLKLGYFETLKWQSRLINQIKDM